MHAIRAFIRSHLYGAHATPHSTRDAARPRTPVVATKPEAMPRRRRIRALTRALVRALRSFDPRHHGAHADRPAPVPR